MLNLDQALTDNRPTLLLFDELAQLTRWADAAFECGDVEEGSFWFFLAQDTEAVLGARAREIAR